MARNKLPPDQIASLSGEIITDTTIALRKLANMGSISGKAKDNALFRQRIADYLDFCIENSVRPGIETAALACGITRKTLWAWTTGYGCDSERQKDAQMFRQFLDSALEMYGLSGQINPVYVIWLQKNWSGYSDNLEIRTQENLSAEHRPAQTPEQIRERYANAQIPTLEEEQ